MEHKRRKFKARRIASSENYEASRRIYRIYVMEHPEERNILEIGNINLRVKVPYTIIMGKKVHLSINETKAHSSIDIKWE